ncbi:hypoxanthine phosphoribosyltransferase [Chlamydiota bacterium]
MKKVLLVLLLTVMVSGFGQGEELDLVLSSAEIAAKIHEAAVQVNCDYADKDLTVVMILKSAICVTADLIRHIDVPFKLEFLRANSYGYNGTKGGQLTIENLDQLEIEGRDVLLVDDIFETGNTILGVMAKLQERHPKSIKTLLLLVKDIPRKTTYRPDYVLFDIPDLFVIGYGLDYKEFYRGLPDIYAFPGNIPPF